MDLSLLRITRLSDHTESGGLTVAIDILEQYSPIKLQRSRKIPFIEAVRDTIRSRGEEINEIFVPGIFRTGGDGELDGSG
jgi:hypothetical protein